MSSESRSNDLSRATLVVGIGASAGGLAAFKRFLASTPTDSGMAFILVQHLDPHHKSLLVELLGAGAPVPVLEAADGIAVRENCVFVIPPDATLTIEDGILRVVSPAPPREHRRPIDTFFASLAQDCGDKAVGVVLSGVGSDGALGVRMIKERGGLTLAQAEFDHVAAGWHAAKCSRHRHGRPCRAGRGHAGLARRLSTALGHGCQIQGRQWNPQRH